MAGSRGAAAYVLLEVALHGLDRPASTIRAEVEALLRDQYGHHLDSDVEVQLVESAGD